MVEEKSQYELIRLREEQNKARHDEVFGGLSPAERVEYTEKAERIHDLESDSKTERSRQWIAALILDGPVQWTPIPSRRPHTSLKFGTFRAIEKPATNRSTTVN